MVLLQAVCWRQSTLFYLLWRCFFSNHWFTSLSLIHYQRPKRCKSLEVSHSSGGHEVQRRDKSKASNCPETGDIHYYSVRSIIEIPFDLEASRSLRLKIDKPWQAQANTSRSSGTDTNSSSSVYRSTSQHFDIFPIWQSIQSCWHRTDGKVYNIRPFLAGRVSILSQESGHAIVNNDTSSCLLIWLGVNRLFCRVLRSCTCGRRDSAVSYWLS